MDPILRDCVILIILTSATYNLYELKQFYVGYHIYEGSQFNRTKDTTEHLIITLRGLFLITFVFRFCYINWALPRAYLQLNNY
jgi:hypothetical protein